MNRDDGTLLSLSCDSDKTVLSKLRQFFKTHNDNQPDEPTRAETTSARSTSLNDKATYHDDAPVGLAAEDRFDRAPFARRVAETIAGRAERSCLTVGIFGVWGDGKTSVLNFISESLTETKDIIQISFNPWRITGEEALLQSFFVTLADGIAIKLKSKSEEVGLLLKQYSFLLKPIPVGGTSEVIAGVGAALSSVSIEELRKRIGENLRASGKRLVVQIDDIDRLDREEIQALFRLVRLSADFENVTYILAFDQTMVAAALGERFATGPEKQNSAGQNFLEKIVQVGLNLPPCSPESLAIYSYERIDRALSAARVVLSEDEASSLPINFQRGVLPRIKTPRMVTRFANAIEFSLGLLKDEVNTADLILIEALRVFYPQLYSAIRDRPGIALGKDRETFKCTDFVRNCDRSLNEVEIEAAVWVLNSLFPRTKTTGYGDDWEPVWAGAKRACSFRYFERYFSYAIRSSDVSDKGIEELLGVAEAEDQMATRTILESLLKPRNALRVIEKLREKSTALQPGASSALATSIAALSGALPTFDGMTYFSSPALQGAILVRNLLKQIPPESRKDAAVRAAASAGSLSFMADLLRWLSSDKEDKDPLLREAEDQQMRDAIATEMLKRLAKLGQPIFETEPKSAEKILSAVGWGLGEARVKEYTSSWLQISPASVEALLMSYVPSAWTVETGISHKTEMMMNNYEALKRVADVELLDALLRAMYPDELDEPVYGLRDKNDPFRPVAHQFMFLKRRADARPEESPSELPPS